MSIIKTFIFIIININVLMNVYFHIGFPIAWNSADSIRKGLDWFQGWSTGGGGGMSAPPPPLSCKEPLAFNSWKWIMGVVPPSQIPSQLSTFTMLSWPPVIKREAAGGLIIPIYPPHRNFNRPAMRGCSASAARPTAVAVRRNTAPCRGQPNQWTYNRSLSF